MDIKLETELMSLVFIVLREAGADHAGHGYVLVVVLPSALRP
jgi:hypothetical protein